MARLNEVEVEMIETMSEHDKWMRERWYGAANPIQAGQIEHTEKLLSEPKNKPFYRRFTKQRF